MSLNKGNNGVYVKGSLGLVDWGGETTEGKKLKTKCLFLIYIDLQNAVYMFYILNPFNPHRNPMKWCFLIDKDNKGLGSELTLCRVGSQTQYVAVPGSVSESKAHSHSFRRSVYCLLNDQNDYVYSIFYQFHIKCW